MIVNGHKVDNDINTRTETVFFTKEYQKHYSGTGLYMYVCMYVCLFLQ